jgi:hypothetical protein
MRPFAVFFVPFVFFVVRPPSGTDGYCNQEQAKATRGRRSPKIAAQSSLKPENNIAKTLLEMNLQVQALKFGLNLPMIALRFAFIE